MPIIPAWFLWAPREPRKRHLGGNAGYCESGIGTKRLMDTVHGTHSRANVDFRWPRNVKVIGSAAGGAARKAAGQRPSLQPTKVGEVAPCRQTARRRIIKCNDQDGCRVAAFGWRGKCPTRFTTYRQS